MKAFLDTSVLVAAGIQKHTVHERAFAVLESVQSGKDEGCSRWQKVNVRESNPSTEGSICFFWNAQKQK